MTTMSPMAQPFYMPPQAIQQHGLDLFNQWVERAAAVALANPLQSRGSAPQLSLPHVNAQGRRSPLSSEQEQHAPPAPQAAGSASA